MKTRKYFFVSITIIFFFLFTFSSISAFSQKESVYYLSKTGKPTTLEHADIMQKIDIKSTSEIVVQSLRLKDAKWEKIHTERYKKVNDSTYQVRSSSLNGKSETINRVYNPFTNNTFKFKDIHKNQIIRVGYCSTKIPLTLQNKVTEYYEGGQIKSISEYSNNELVSNQNWNENGEKYIDNIFYSVDVEPAFVPGMKVLHQHLLKGFIDAGIDVKSIVGSLVIGFVVTEQGRIDGIKILKGLIPGINSVAVQSFASLAGDWNPAKLNNQKVRYFQVFPINFINKEQRFDFAEFNKGRLNWGAY